MVFEIIFNGNRINDEKRAEEVFKEANLRKTDKFTYFCDIILGVERLTDRINGKLEKVIYDYDEKSGSIKCSVSVLRAENGLSDTMYFFRYMINRVDVFEVKPSDDGLELSFEIKDIFEEVENCHIA